MTSTKVTYGALNNKVNQRRIETVNLTEISVELDSSAPCGCDKKESISKVVGHALHGGGGVTTLCILFNNYSPKAK